MARVLIVDDADFIRMMLTRIIEAAGHEVVGEAIDGDEALERYPDLRPDVVILDITLPQRDGLTVLRELRALDPGARVVMCSAHGQSATVLDSIQLGARDFVVKPFEVEAVGRAIDKALAA
jgi:two-component system chemotaxis response regulator CheY